MFQLLMGVGERIFGMLPETFASLVVPVAVIVITLLVWALTWRPPPE
ncbi:MAG: hypothetical protein N3F04_02145 [Candidatus Nezhaarchaeota archaeon]|nr:hypothetical protein [Candidatus Nezhaarchaeota archaeon]MCX8141580.1 hypothetical protein [Candidatus Nezhaarchaeota archaeon]MDW8049847.1 hypothetical protein [Nitrososphaerota archaeon]